MCVSVCVCHPLSVYLPESSHCANDKIFLNVQNTELSTPAGLETVLICRSPVAYQPRDQALPCQVAQQKYLCLDVFNILCSHHSHGKFNYHEVSLFSFLQYQISECS